MINLRLCNGKVPIRNTGNVDIIILVDFPTKEVFQEMYRKYHSAASIDKHYAVVRMRADGNTLEVCGKHFGITKQRVREIEAKFLRKMQEYRSSLKTGSL